MDARDKRGHDGSEMVWKKRFKRTVNRAAGAIAVALLRLLRHTDPDRMARVAGFIVRKTGPLLREHRLGRDNLTKAFPEKSPREIDGILTNVWDNLGRLSTEFAHLDRLWDWDPNRGTFERIEFTPQSEVNFIKLRDDGKPALVFAAHLGNWELPALAAPAHGLDSAVVYRMPNIGNAAAAIRDMRAVVMGELIQTTFDTGFKVARALERGAHVGMLVDQYSVQGVDVQFFGRPTKANSMIARLAREFECPIHGARVIRLPEHRFRLELTDEVTPIRDTDGRIDIQPTMQKITAVVEQWVREYPDQWLWLHRRWR